MRSLALPLLVLCVALSVASVAVEGVDLLNPPPAFTCSPGSAPASGSSCSTTSTPRLTGTTGTCCKCPSGQYSTNGFACQLCVNGRVTLEAAGVDLTTAPGATSCSCVAGFGDYDVNSKVCRQCPVNYKSSSNKCVACAAGTYAGRGASVCTTTPVQPNGLPTKPPAVSCSPGSAPNAAGTGCVQCPAGQYSADGMQCRACINGKVVNHGVDMSSSTAGATQCNCLSGYGDWSVSTMTCAACAVNFYSSNFKCVACAAGTFAPRGSGSCTAVQCAAGSYMPPGGSVLANCVKCGYGTTGRVCGAMTACKCEAGFSNFDPTTGRCFQCATNSISIYADMVKQDESKTVCAVCPKLTAPSADKRTCAPVAGASSNIAVYPSTPIPGPSCGCVNGYNYAWALSDATGTNLVSRTLSYNVNYDSADVINPYTPSSLITQQGAGFGLILDRATNLAIAVFKLTHLNSQNKDTIEFQGGNFGGTNNIGLVYMGLTCAAARTLAVKTAVSMPCVYITLGDPLTVVTDQIPSALTTGANWAVSASCGAALTYCSYKMAFGAYTPVKYDATVTTVTTSDKSFLLKDFNDIGATGVGSFNWGDKVIAFYSQTDNKIKWVMKRSDSSTEILVSPTHPSVGTVCALSSTIKGCFVLTNQWVSITSVMNSISPDSVVSNTDVYITGGCGNITT